MGGFDHYFRAATGFPDPHDYQKRLACGERGRRREDEWLRDNSACKSMLIDIPTGMGKTAAVVLAWLWNRVSKQRNDWPRRLVYCLPMRTLVEQTYQSVDQWLRNLDQKESVKAHVLMGGEYTGDWDIHPERDAILVGTQDMLLSRALNRGYGMSRYRWPMHFGLLNNDCLWVMDEVQLMGPGLGTACQLEAFRTSSKSSHKGFCSTPDNRSETWYMSATTNADHLRTREWRSVPRPKNFSFSLTDEEKTLPNGPIHDRRFAVKKLKLRRGLDFGDKERGPDKVITCILKRHEEMVNELAQSPTETKLPRRTIIICNTVDRAIGVHTKLRGQKPDKCDLILLHSRFRPPERWTHFERLDKLDLSKFPNGQIVVATQVIEAGVDLSSAMLWSEVAPLASLTQRLGRLNRAGEFNDSTWTPLAFIVGVGVQSEIGPENKQAKEKREKENTRRCLPYDLASCESTWDSLEKLKGNASPFTLVRIKDDIAESIPRCPYSLQRHELLDFFDTDANLSLGFTDVSPFVRGIDADTDIHVLWREDWPEHPGKPEFFPDYQRDELCSVPIGKAKEARRFILNKGWLWRGKESGWISIRESGLAPGMIILLPVSAGGYDNHTGWTGKPKNKEHGSHYEQREFPPDEDLLSCLSHGWRSIADHTSEVAEEMDSLLKKLPNHIENVKAFTHAVPWHDVGKSHPKWQEAVAEALNKARIDCRSKPQPFAKFSLSESPKLRNEDGSLLSGKELNREVKKLRRLFKPKLTHEVPSALAFRQSEQKRHGADRPIASLLAEYLIMSHHGRVRKVLRDEIPRLPKDVKDENTVRGVANGDKLPATAINGRKIEGVFISTDCRRMGRDRNGHESYTRGVLRLLDIYGPFRLAFFETLFRTADVRASKKASQEQND